MDEATEQAIRRMLDMYVETGDVVSYHITGAGKIEARLTEKGEIFIDFMGEFYDSFTEESLC
jgi:hypothetical protein